MNVLVKLSSINSNNTSDDSYLFETLEKSDCREYDFFIVGARVPKTVSKFLFDH